MKIKDLKAILFGNVTLKRWNEETEDFTIVYSSTHFNVIYLSEELQDAEVTAIYADTIDTEQNFVHVEIK